MNTKEDSTPITMEQMIAVTRQALAQAGIQPLPQPQPMVDNMIRVQGGVLNVGKLMKVVRHMLEDAENVSSTTEQDLPKEIQINGKKFTRHHYCKGCSKDHPGLDCEGKKVECRRCHEMGHREYECPLNPKSVFFRGRAKAEEEKKQRWEEVNKTEETRKANEARWKAYEEIYRRRYHEEKFRIDLKKTYDILKRMEEQLLDRLRMTHNYVVARDNEELYMEAMEREVKEYLEWKEMQLGEEGETSEEEGEDHPYLKKARMM